MNKFKLLNILSTYKPKTTSGIEGVVVKLNNILSSKYFGDFHVYRGEFWADPENLNVDRLNDLPDMAFITTLTVTGDNGVEENIDSHFLYSIKNIDGVIYSGVFYQSPRAGFSPIGLLRLDLGERVFKVVKCGVDALTEVMQDEDDFDGVLEIPLKFLIHATNCEMLVKEYEPSTFAFKKKVKPLDREHYRTYDFVKPEKVVVDPMISSKGRHSRKTIMENILEPTTEGKPYVDRLNPSIFFSGMDDLVVVGKPYPTVDLSHVPFGNFTIATNSIKGIKSQFYVVNCLRVTGGLEVSVFYNTSADQRSRVWVLGCVFLWRDNYSLTDILVNPLQYPKDYSGPDYGGQITKASMRSILPSLQDVIKSIISNFLHLVMNYETDKVAGSFKRNKRANKSTNEDYIANNVHLVLDFNKRRQYPITKGSKVSGYHVKEHDRIGHIRRYANGRQIFINAVRINEGKGEDYGKVSKEYAL